MVSWGPKGILINPHVCLIICSEARNIQGLPRRGLHWVCGLLGPNTAEVQGLPTRQKGKKSIISNEWKARRTKTAPVFKCPKHTQQPNTQVENAHNKHTQTGSRLCKKSRESAAARDTGPGAFLYRLAAWQSDSCRHPTGSILGLEFDVLPCCPIRWTPPNGGCLQERSLSGPLSQIPCGWEGN